MIYLHFYYFQWMKIDSYQATGVPTCGPLRTEERTKALARRGRVAATLEASVYRADQLPEAPALLLLLLLKLRKWPRAASSRIRRFSSMLEPATQTASTTRSSSSISILEKDPSEPALSEDNYFLFTCNTFNFNAIYSTIY